MCGAQALSAHCCGQCSLFIPQLCCWCCCFFCRALGRRTVGKALHAVYLMDWVWAAGPDDRAGGEGCDWLFNGNERQSNPALKHTKHTRYAFKHLYPRWILLFAVINIICVDMKTYICSVIQQSGGEVEIRWRCWRSVVVIEKWQELKVCSDEPELGWKCCKR